MANQYVNKVEYGNDTLIDLTGDSVTPQTLLPNTTAHNRSGAPISGSASASVLPAVDTENILGGGAGASTNTQAMLDGLADGYGAIRTDLSDYHVVPSKNLFVPHNVGLVSSGGNVGADTFVAPGGGNTAVVGKLEHNTDYVASKIGGNRFRIVLSENYPAVGGACYVVVSDENLSNYTFNSGTYNYVLLHCYNSSQTDKYIVDTIKPMLCTAADYAADPSYKPYWVCMRDGMFPRAEQRVLGSKNLLPITATSQTVSGITWTVYRDSRGRVTSIVANGTATARSNLSTDVVVEQEHLNQYGQQRYILSGCPSGGSASTYYLYLHPGKTNGSWNPAVADVGNGVSFEYDGQTKIFCACTIMSGVTVSNLVYKPMIRLASDPDDTYVPYAMTNMELTEGNIKYPVKLTSSNNINDIKTPGFYYWGDSLPTNLPGTLYYSSMSVQRLWTDGKIIQIIQRNGEIYTHAWTGSAWNGWYKFTGTAV